MKPEDVKHELIVKKWLQLRYVLYFVGMLAAGAAILGVALYRHLRADLRLAMFQGHSRLDTPWEAVGQRVLAANAVAVSALLLASLALVVALSITVALAARRLNRNVRDYVAGVEPEHWRPIRHPRELRHLQWLLARGLEAHRAHVARVRLGCGQLRHELGQARERMILEGAAPDHARLRALHRRFHDALSGYRFFRLP